MPDFIKDNMMAIIIVLILVAAGIYYYYYHTTPEKYTPLRPGQYTFWDGYIR